jgi:hypothetical protein
LIKSIKMEENKMNNLMIVGIVVGILIVGGIAMVSALSTAQPIVASTPSSTGTGCGRCSGTCTSSNGCGAATCGATNGGTCTCGK